MLRKLRLWAPPGFRVWEADGSADTHGYGMNWSYAVKFNVDKAEMYDNQVGDLPVARAHNRLTPFLTLIAVAFLAGCAGGDVSPVNMGISESGQAYEKMAAGNRALWGYWDCVYDSETGEMEFVPSRSVMWHINFVSTINDTDGLKMVIDYSVSDPPNGLVVADIELTHPYPQYDFYAAFDVRGILITTAGMSVGELRLPGKNDTHLRNADGYTRWWNPMEFTTEGMFGYTPGRWEILPPTENPIASVINPYKVFANALGKEDDVEILAGVPLDGDNGRGVFRPGSVLERRYEIVFPVDGGAPVTYFSYAIDISWDEPENPNPEIPDDFGIDVNSVEPWLFTAELTGNTLEFEAGGSSGGAITVDLDIWDWQGLVNGYDGQLGGVEAFSPGIEFTGIVYPTFSETGNGNATASVMLSGIPVTYGTVPVWIGVECPGTSWVQGPEDAPRGEIMAYTKIDVEIPGGSGDMDWFVHAFILRDSEGHNAATTYERIRDDISWANEFYGIWLDGTVTLAGISTIDKTAWMSLTETEASELFGQYGDRSGVLNVFYVDSTPDMGGSVGWAIMECEFFEQRSDTAFVVINDMADHATLSHEMGHSNCMLVDAYLLDDTPCSWIKNLKCPNVDWDIYCHISTAVMGNLMYYNVGEDVNDYFLTDADKEMITPEIESQCENAIHFHTNYPENYHAP